MNSQVTLNNKYAQLVLYVCTRRQPTDRKIHKISVVVHTLIRTETRCWRHYLHRLLLVAKQPLSEIVQE